MALRICDYCDRAYLDSGEEESVALCQSCDEELQGIYMFAWSYLRDSTTDEGKGRHRKVSATRLAEELGVDLKAIELLIRIGKIQIESPDEHDDAKMAGKKLEILRKIGKGIKRDSKYTRGRK